MITHPGEFEDLNRAKLARYLSPEDFENMQKAKNEAFKDVVKSFTTFISRIFKKKTV